MVFKPNKAMRNCIIVMFVLITAAMAVEIADSIEYSKGLVYEKEKAEMQILILGLIGLLILVYAILIWVWICAGRTIAMSEKGCTISLWHYKKEYTWDDFKVKAVVDISNTFRPSSELIYEKGIIFSLHALRKRKLSSTRKRKLSSTRKMEFSPSGYCAEHPFSYVCIYFAPEQKKIWHDTYYEVDEKVFMEKMKEWGIELEEISF